MNDHSDYSDYELLIRTARLERSAALGNAIVGLFTMTVSGLRRWIAVLKAAAGRSKARAGADGNGARDVPAHR